MEILRPGLHVIIVQCFKSKPIRKSDWFHTKFHKELSPGTKHCSHYFLFKRSLMFPIIDVVMLSLKQTLPTFMWNCVQEQTGSKVEVFRSMIWARCISNTTGLVVLFACQHHEVTARHDCLITELSLFFLTRWLFVMVKQVIKCIPLSHDVVRWDASTSNC